MVLVIILLIAFFIVWASYFVLFNDLLLKSISTEKYNNILFIFSHMDDETMLAGGLMARAASEGKNVTLLTLTKGERGNKMRRVDPQLPAQRRKELERALSIFKVKNLIHLQYEDETLTEKKSHLKKDIQKAIIKVKPDLIVTLDLRGWYGHPDHIVCAEAVTELRKMKFPGIPLWYAIRPEAINRAARLVAHLTARGAFVPRTSPQYKLFIGRHIFQKIKAIYAYKSQIDALRPGVTIGPIPMWFFLSASLYEYIAEA